MGQPETITENNVKRIKRTESRVYAPEDIGNIMGFSTSMARKFIQKVHEDTSGKYFVVFKINTMYKIPMKQFDDWFDQLSSNEIYDIQTMFDDE